MSRKQPKGVATLLTAHLLELRKRLLIGLLPIIPLMVLGVWFSLPVLERIFGSVRLLGLPLHLYSLTDGLTLRLRVGFLIGLGLDAPWLAVQLMMFAQPGLKKSEFRYSAAAAIVAGLAFAGGLAFCYFTVAPSFVLVFAAGKENLLLNVEKTFSAFETASIFLGAVFALIAMLLYLLYCRRLLKISTRKG